LRLQTPEKLVGYIISVRNAGKFWGILSRREPPRNFLVIFFWRKAPRKCLGYVIPAGSAGNILKKNLDPNPPFPHTLLKQFQEEFLTPPPSPPSGGKGLFFQHWYMFLKCFCLKNIFLTQKLLGFLIPCVCFFSYHNISFSP
jgi:hypothetical protein